VSYLITFYFIFQTFLTLDIYIASVRTQPGLEIPGRALHQNLILVKPLLLASRRNHRLVHKLFPEREREHFFDQ